MDWIFSWVMPCFYSFMACVGFCLIFNIHGPGIVICGSGGALGWLIYLIVEAFGCNVFACNLLAAIAITLFSEGMARIRRCPVSGYLLIALLPLVPGGGIYQAMLHCVLGETELFLSALLRTLGIAGALSLGAVLGSTVMRIFFSAFNRSGR
jgi:uncharacterized membrane protein YjjB (DUF3815 family)